VQVFIAGGVGPMHSDVSLAGVAKGFGVRLVRFHAFPFLILCGTVLSCFIGQV
jgi:hypothetical protein